MQRSHWLCITSVLVRASAYRVFPLGTVIVTVLPVSGRSGAPNRCCVRAVAVHEAEIGGRRGEEYMQPDVVPEQRDQAKGGSLIGNPWRAKAPAFHCVP